MDLGVKQTCEFQLHLSPALHPWSVPLASLRLRALFHKMRTVPFGRELHRSTCWPDARHLGNVHTLVFVFRCKETIRKITLVVHYIMLRVYRMFRVNIT